MKKITLIIILAILISLAVITPVLAKAGPGEKGACYVTWHPRQYGPSVRNYHAAGNGWFGSPWFGLSQACWATPPKTPFWAH